MIHAKLRGLPESVIALLARAADPSPNGDELSRHAPSRETGSLCEAIADLGRALSGLKELEDMNDGRFRFHGFQIELGLTFRHEHKEQVLRDVESFELTCAPEMVSRFEIAKGESVLICRYRACVHGRLIPGDHYRGPFQEAAGARFLDEMRRLNARGLIHGYAHRGFFHSWMVASDTGAILLDQWDEALREYDSKREAEEALGIIERRLARVHDPRRPSRR